MKYQSLRLSFWLLMGAAALLAAPSTSSAQNVLTIRSATELPPNMVVMSQAGAPGAATAPATPQTVVLNSNACCNCDPCWTCKVIPYLWLPAARGDLTLRGVTVPVDVSIGKSWDLFTQDLNFAAIGQVEGSNGTYGFIFNGVYSDVSPGRRIRNLDFSANSEMAIVDMAVTWRCDSFCQACCAPTGICIEGLAGVRYIDIEGGLTITGPLGNTVSVNGTEEWLDPFIGGRVRMPVCDGLTLQLRGDIGGFDLGDASSFTWNVEAMIEYQLSCRCSLLAGWRWLDIDYKAGRGNQEFGYDMLLDGPVLGLIFKF